MKPSDRALNRPPTLVSAKILTVLSIVLQLSVGAFVSNAGRLGEPNSWCQILRGGPSIGLIVQPPPDDHDLACPT